MKTIYPLSSPPRNPGIYALTNRVTRHVYIGKTNDLRRRYAEWKGVFVSGIGAKSKEILRVAGESRPEDWEFSVLLDLPDADEATLLRHEESAIRRVREKHPDGVLNNYYCALQQTEPRSDYAHNANGGRKTTVTHHGAELTYSEVARVLGCTPHSVGKRLAGMRKRGVHAVELEALKAASARYRQLPKTPTP